MEMRGILGASVLALILGLSGSGPGSACSCMSSPPPVIAFIGADAVFEGIVTAIELEAKVDENPKSVSSADLMRVSLRAVRAWKGLETADVVVFTVRESSSCGYPFEIGQRYLVYANARVRGLATGLCTRTQPAWRAHADFRDLGAASWVAGP